MSVFANWNRWAQSTSLIAVGFVVGCTSDSTSSVPESIRRKAREATSSYAPLAVADAQREESPTAAAPTSAVRARGVISPHEDWSMRKTAMFALGRIGAPAVPHLIQAVRSPDPEVRHHAVETLSRIGPEAGEAVPDLVRALNDQDPLVRKTAARALGQIGPSAAEAVPALLRLLVESPE